MAERWFTPKTAREALDRIRPAAERLCRLFRGLEAHRPRRIQPDQPVDRLYFRLLVDAQATREAIEGEGGLIQDPRRGLVDFPARRAGRQVLLCWRVGEPSLAWWHETEGGERGRRPVDEDGPWDEYEGPAGPVG